MQDEPNVESKDSPNSPTERSNRFVTDWSMDAPDKYKVEWGWNTKGNRPTRDVRFVIAYYPRSGYIWGWNAGGFDLTRVCNNRKGYWSGGFDSNACRRCYSNN